jgi:hypothetical protein
MAEGGGFESTARQNLTYRKTEYLPYVSSTDLVLCFSMLFCKPLQTYLFLPVSRKVSGKFFVWKELLSTLSLFILGDNCEPITFS